jgi:antitoxin component YwqK of YwqJK toxin-antitoxin module
MKHTIKQVMRPSNMLSLLAASLLLTGCLSNNSADGIVSQKFVHKYGFDVSQAEWDAREKEGQIVTVLKSGEKITNSYENGILHGLTTQTFPNSPVVEKLMNYNQGVLLKEVVHDQAGIPIAEDMYEFDNRKISTIWDEKGIPLSVEEYDNDLLVEGKYFTSNHELEGQVEAGFGERYVRDRSGLLVSRDLIENGVVSARTNYHANGQIHSISHYQDYQLHGEQRKFASNGQPLMDLNWNHGVLDGIKVVYRNGHKVSEIPYISGHRHGLEYHYDEAGMITANIEWKNDKKHGCSRFLNSNTSENEWYYRGAIVSQEKFEMLNGREELIADLSFDN